MPLIWAHPWLFTRCVVVCVYLPLSLNARRKPLVSCTECILIHAELSSESDGSAGGARWRRCPRVDDTGGGNAKREKGSRARTHAYVTFEGCVRGRTSERTRSRGEDDARDFATRGVVMQCFFCESRFSGIFIEKAMLYYAQILRSGLVYQISVFHGLVHAKIKCCIYFCGN